MKEEQNKQQQPSPEKSAPCSPSERAAGGSCGIKRLKKERYEQLHTSYRLVCRRLFAGSDSPYVLALSPHGTALWQIEGDQLRLNHQRIMLLNRIAFQE